MKKSICLAVLLSLAAPVAAQACNGCGCTASKNAPAIRHDEAHDTKFERDRKAILAMAGEYRVKFQFHETVAVKSGYELKEPYTSNADELVTVVADTGKFISLQHVLVVTGEDGRKRVVKHWRQDWRYEDTTLLEYRGHRVWQRTELSPEQIKGKWSQSVWQVDDSPRYDGVGEWVHTGERSAWESGETWRPLPRREYTKRTDYQVLVASNRHTITPAGWVHEQDNYKLVVDDQHQPVEVLAHEAGLNVYDRCDDVDLAAGHAYWRATAAYWQDVRETWSQVLGEPERITVHDKIGARHLHKQMFRMAGQVHKAGEYDAETMRPKIRQTIVAFVE